MDLSCEARSVNKVRLRQVRHRPLPTTFRSLRLSPTSGCCVSPRPLRGIKSSPLISICALRPSFCICHLLVDPHATEIEGYPTMLAVALMAAAAVTATLYMFRYHVRCSETIISAVRKCLQFRLNSSSGQEYKTMYDKKTTQKFVKSQSILRPCLILRDPLLIKNVLMRDFEYFTDRPHRGNSGELFDLDGEEWRTARRKLLPVFSPEPLEGMFKYFTANLGTLITRISRELGDSADVRRPIETCVSDIISLAIFGLEITIGQTKDEFTNKALSVIEMGFFQSIKASFFGDGPSWGTEKYFKGFLRRELQSSRPNDFVNMMRKMKEKTGVGEKLGVYSPNKVFDGEYLDTPLDGKPIQITDEFLSDQIFQFLTSGFQPIVSAVTFALYDLSAATLDLQTEIRNEITASISKNGGYSYDAVREMRLLDRCINESLRLHPVVHSLKRICVKDYKEEEVAIRRGECVVISVLGLHRDERHFPDPDNFLPTRFEDPEAITNSFYMPFGCGPRKCIGSHFTLLVIKVILAKLVQQFKFSLSDGERAKTPHKYRGSYILPNDIKFGVSFAKPPTMLT